MHQGANGGIPLPPVQPHQVPLWYRENNFFAINRYILLNYVIIVKIIRWGEGNVIDNAELCKRIPWF